MDWHDFIVSTPGVLGGKPAVKGTRLSADFILGLFAAGWTTATVLEQYPSLSDDAIRAVFAYAADVLQDESVFPLPAAN